MSRGGVFPRRWRCSVASRTTPRRWRFGYSSATAPGAKRSRTAWRHEQAGAALASLPGSTAIRGQRRSRCRPWRIRGTFTTNEVRGAGHGRGPGTLRRATRGQLVNYMASSATAARLMTLDTRGQLLDAQPDTWLGTVAATLEMFCCAAVVDDRVSGIGDSRGVRSGPRRLRPARNVGWNVAGPGGPPVTRMSRRGFLGRLEAVLGAAATWSAGWVRLTPRPIHSASRWRRSTRSIVDGLTCKSSARTSGLTCSSPRRSNAGNRSGMAAASDAPHIRSPASQMWTSAALTSGP